MDSQSSSNIATTSAAGAVANDHGWQKVSYPKRRRNPLPSTTADVTTAVTSAAPQVFASLEKQALDRRRAIEAAAAAAEDDDVDFGAAKSRRGKAAEEDEEESSGNEEKENGGAEEVKKVKKVKVKKAKVSVAEAAARIAAEDLAAFLAEISVSFESQQDIQLMRFADFFARAFAVVSASQFPWAKLFKESPVAKIADIPLCYISEPVYNTSARWIAQKSTDCLGNFVLWCFDAIFADLTAQIAASKGSKKLVQQTPSKAQVAVFVVLAIVLKRKPDILISLLHKIKDDTKYQGQDKLPVIVWAIAQAHQGDPVVGMYLWSHYLFPAVCSKSSVNPQSRDLILQLVERILSGPKARTVLSNGAVRKGERLVPPATLDLLMRITFPLPTSRVKATERFEAVYPTIKELALAETPGTKTTKQASQQLLPCAFQAMQESNPELTNEATAIFIWCLTQNEECYRLWEKLYPDNLEASVAVLKQLSSEWKQYSGKISSDALRVTVKNLKTKNEEALSGDVDANKVAYFKESDKYCKSLLRKSSKSSNCSKVAVFLLPLAIAVYFTVSLNELQGLEKQVRAYLSNFQS